MKTLALEFSSDRRSVALADGDRPVAEAIETLGRETHPFALIASALREARWEARQIQRLVVGLGPGSYTGVRLGIALVQGWHLAQGTETGGLSSVASLVEAARDAGQEGRIDVAIDAQRGEFYHAAYDLGPESANESLPLRIVSKAAILELICAGRVVIGPDAALGLLGGRRCFPTATALARRAGRRFARVSPEHLEPIYLRTPTYIKAPTPRPIPG